MSEGSRRRITPEEKEFWLAQHDPETCEGCQWERANGIVDGRLPDDFPVGKVVPIPWTVAHGDTDIMHNDDS